MKLIPQIPRLIFVALVLLLTSCSTVYYHHTLLNHIKTVGAEVFIYEEYNHKTGQWRLVSYTYFHDRIEPVVTEIGKSRP